VTERSAVAGAVLVVAGIATNVLGLGGAHPTVLLASAPVLLIGCAMVLLSRPAPVAWPWPSWLALALSGYSLLQALPLPIGFLSVVSARAADVWARALHPFGEPVAWGSVSLDPGAASREALKWALYAVVFLAALRLARRFGTQVLALTLLGLGVALAVASLGHRIAGAEKVFGLYAPLSGAESAKIGPLLNPNALSGCLNLTAYVGLGLAFSRRVATLRWLVAVCTAILFAVSVLSGSRGGVWMLPLGLTAFAAMRVASARNALERRRVAWAGVAFGACVATYVLLVMNDSMQRALLQNDFDKLRMAAWVRPMLKDYWLFGVGRGAFESVFPSYAPPLGNLVYSHPENFVVQWATEWGVPVTAIGLGWFAKELWSVRSGILRSSVRSGAAIGAASLVLHNLVDFSLELPGVALCFVVTIAVIWSPFAPRLAPRRTGTFWRIAGVLLAGGLVWVVAVSFGRRNVEMDRAELHHAFSSAADRHNDAFFARLRRAMLAHPAEPYFSRLGATAALDTPGSDAMPWIQRALERGLNEARTHMLAARGLAKRGAVRQALFELGLAMQLDGGVAPSAATYAAAWSSDAVEVESIAPPGRPGAAFLTETATRSKDEEQRLGTLRAALRKDSGFFEARLRLLALLIRRFEYGACSDSCRTEIAEQIRDIGRSSESRSSRVLDLLASGKEALGERRSAYEILRAGCAEIYGPTRVECFASQLRVAERLFASTPSELTLAAARIADEGCLTVENCAALLDAVGTLLQKSGEPGRAMEYLEKATSVEPTGARFLKAAEAALELGRQARASYLLKSAEQAARTADDAALVARIVARRDELLRRAHLP
jgi:hypothetical protein